VSAALVVAGSTDFDLQRHKWTRYRIAMPGLDDILTTIHAAYDRADYGPWLQNYSRCANIYKIADDVAVANELLATDQLIDLAHAWAQARHPSSLGDTPAPKPDLRFMPRQ
jgi:hypothetical protein